MNENYAVLWNNIAQRDPDALAIRTAQREYSYGELAQAADQVADALAAHGITSGDRVAFFLHNTAEYLIAFYACLKLEAIHVAVNYRLKGAELADLLQVSEPTAMFYGAAYREAVGDALRLLHERDLSAPTLLVEVPAHDGSADGLSGLGDLEALGATAVLFEGLAGSGAEIRGSQPVAARPEPRRDAQLYIFTGGTTGTPKAVVWGIGDILQIQESSIYGPLRIDPPQDIEAAVDIATRADRADVVMLPLAPFIHATALFSAMNTLVSGGIVVISATTSLVPTAAAKAILEGGVTRLIVAGNASAMPLLDAIEEQIGDGSSSLTSVISSGMRLSDETKKRFHALGDVTIVDILASTEGGPYAMATSTSVADIPAVFRLTPDAVVLDSEQREVQRTPGATGVLAYRGALPQGYLNDPEKTAETYPVINGVRHCSPGDVVEVGRDGEITLLGRGSAVVNTGGEKVFPTEVEEALLGHPNVTDAVVFGVPDPRWGEAVTAVVEVAAGANTNEEELRDYLGAKLAGFKKPQTIMIRPSLERTPTGKLNMRALQAAVLEEKKAARAEAKAEKKFVKQRARAERRERKTS